MARITKEMKELMEKYWEYKFEIDHNLFVMDEIYHKLKELGMTEKQLENRDLHEHLF